MARLGGWRAGRDPTSAHSQTRAALSAWWGRGEHTLGFSIKRGALTRGLVCTAASLGTAVVCRGRWSTPPGPAGLGLEGAWLSPCSPVSSAGSLEEWEGTLHVELRLGTPAGPAPAWALAATYTGRCFGRGCARLAAFPLILPWQVPTLGLHAHAWGECVEPWGVPPPGRLCFGGSGCLWLSRCAQANMTLLGGEWCWGYGTSSKHVSNAGSSCPTGLV